MRHGNSSFPPPPDESRFLGWLKARVNLPRFNGRCVGLMAIMMERRRNLGGAVLRGAGLNPATCTFIYIRVFVLRSCVRACVRACIPTMRHACIRPCSFIIISSDKEQTRPTHARAQTHTRRSCNRSKSQGTWKIRLQVVRPVRMVGWPLRLLARGRGWRNDRTTEGERALGRKRGRGETRRERTGQP